MEHIHTYEFVRGENCNVEYICIECGHVLEVYNNHYEELYLSSLGHLIYDIPVSKETEL